MLSFNSNYFVHSHIFNTSGLQGFELAKHKKLEKPLKTAGDCEIRTQIGSVCQDTQKRRLRPTILKVFEHFSHVEISSRSRSDTKKYTVALPQSVIAAHLSPSVACFRSMPKCSFHSFVPGKLCDQALNQREELFLL